MWCGYAQGSEAPTPSDQLHPYLRDFLELRQTIGAGRIGRGGTEVCRALTSSLDSALESLASEVETEAPIAVVATGGYGRGELAPFSDVDLMLLHGEDDPSQAAAGVFRPLWDAGLRLGHSVRTVKEAAYAARQAVETHTTLLTSRLVAGAPELFGQLQVEVAAVTKARPLRRFLVKEERERRRQSPYLLMDTDVKSGRGGLRTLHGFEWERRREELIGRFSPESGIDEAEARETLLSIRNALHVAAGRRYDVYSYDLREPVARWLGADQYEIGERLVQAVRTVDHLASQRWPELVDQGHSLVSRVWGHLRGRESQRLEGSDLSRDEFVTLLRSGEQGRLALERLYQSGHLDRVLPEWVHVRAIPQLAPFHEHPVDAHLWRTVEEMQGLIEGSHGHYSSIAENLDPDILALAAFLHDIGKGHGGNHSEVGAEIAEAFCGRLGLPDEVSAFVRDAVRHHLLLSRTATRRDLDDPAVIDEVVDMVGDLKLLQALYLLTVADARATGHTMWNEWKATLLRTLYERCAARLGEEKAETGTTVEGVLSEVGEGRRREVESHLRAMPAEYLRSVSSDDVSWHVELIDRADTGWALGTREGRVADTAVVVGRSQSELRRVVAQAFAANGIDVLEARLLTRSDGVIVDTFQVHDDRTGGSLAPVRWDQVRSDVEAALCGDLDTGSKVAIRAEAYSSTTLTGVEPDVGVSVDAATGDGVITVKCSDRIGRLAQILAILSESGLSIQLAKLDSRAGEVMDTFHVSATELPDDTSRLERHIERSIRQS